MRKTRCFALSLPFLEISQSMRKPIQLTNPESGAANLLSVVYSFATQLTSLRKALIRFFAGFCLVSPALLFGQSLDTFEHRKTAILQSLRDAKLHERGKHGLPKACARLWNNPNDTTATRYITTALNHPEQSMFDFPGIALALGKFRNSFRPEQLELIKADLERLAKEDKVNGQGFLGHGTENHATMMWTSAYLFGQYFPDAKWINGWTSAQLMAEMKERMRVTFRNVYQHGYTEYLSTAYEVIMNYPVAILLEFAEDQEMKDIARAFLLYKWSLQSLNNFEGNMIAPYGRMIAQEDHQPNDALAFKIPTLFAHWLYWGWGENTGSVKMSYFEDYSATSHVIYCALSDVNPENLLLTLGNHQTPFTGLSSASTFGNYGKSAPHMMMRKFYRDRTFAIGTGNFRWIPGGDYADHDTNPFNILWSSNDRFNFINCTHPYWYSDGDDPDRTPDTWHNGGLSPFMQTAHHQNTAIVLFNIPQKDPWVGKPSAEKWGWRDGHADNLIKRGMLRYPKSVDEKIEKAGWIFLREGETFIGIKPLKSYYEQTNLKGRGLDGFNIIKSDHAQTGFIFEVGTAATHNSFREFQNKLITNKVSINWAKLTVDYTDSRKNLIHIQYQPGLRIKEEFVPEHVTSKDIKGMAESVPVVKINSKPEIPYEQWPMLKSPLINMDGGKLEISDKGKTQIRVDWSGKYPKITEDEHLQKRASVR